MNCKIYLKHAFTGILENTLIGFPRRNDLFYEMLLAVCSCLHISYLSKILSPSEFWKEVLTSIPLLLTLWVMHTSELEKSHHSGKYMDQNKQ